MANSTKTVAKINSRDLISTIGKYLIEERKPFIKVEKDEDALWIMKITLQDGNVRNPSDSLKMLTSWRM